MRSELIIGGILFVLLVLGGVVLWFVSDNPTPPLSEEGTSYPSYVEIENPSGFVNTDSITIGELIGKKVILVDFMTYSCINCRRTFPYLVSWYEKYKDQGLEIVGIHTPEFAFEKNIDNVRRAMKEVGITYPVVLDNDYATWLAYDNHFWPRKYLIDIKGNIVYDHIGEGAYQETEEKIVELLNERSHILGTEENVTVDDSKAVQADEVSFAKIGSPEIYFGSSRVENINNLPSQACLLDTCRYEIGNANPPLNTYELEGLWKTYPERIELEEGAGSIKLTFYANTVNIVAGSTSGVTIRVFLDGVPIDEEKSGERVSGGAASISEDDLYNLIDLRGEYGEHTLELKIDTGDFRAFTFTFG